MRTLWARLLGMFSNRRADADLRDEIEAHVQLLVDDHLRRGLSHDDARAAARRDFGGVEQMKETYRDQRGLRFVETLGQDVRYGLRVLRKSPGFTAVAVVSLALGIGANATVFTFVNALLLRPMPVPDPHALVEINAQRRGDFAVVSFPMYRDLRDRQQVFTGIFASAGETPSRVTIPGPTGGSTDLDNIRVSFVSGNYFAVLDVQAILGRVLTDEDDRTPHSSETLGSVIVISDAFWQRQFSRDPTVLGRTIVVGRSRCTVVGVAPPGFIGESVGAAAVGWVPLVTFSDKNDLENRRGSFASYVARLAPGVSRDQAQTAVTATFRQLLAAEGIVRDPISDYRIALGPAATGIDLGLRRQFAMPLRIAMAVVVLVLLIACANVANLLLVRAMARRAEIGIRLALGCSRGRLLRQLSTESLLLSTFGAAAGVGVAWAASRLLAGTVDVGRLDVTPDRTVLAFLVVISLAAAMMFGLAPAFRVIRDVAPGSLRIGRGGGTPGRVRLSRGLVAAQIAVSLLLTVTAGLLIRSVENLHAVDYGFRPDHVVIFDLAGVPPSNEPTALANHARTVYQRVTQLPGIRSASLSSILLFSPTDVVVPLTVRGYPAAPDERPVARFNEVSAAYLETVGLTLLDGRGFGAQDRLGAPLVALVNESLARRYFRGRVVVGGILEIDSRRAAMRTPGASTGAFGKPIEIVGVVRDAKFNNLRSDVRPMVYFSIEQFPRNLRSLEVRTDRPLSAIVAPVREALADASKDTMIRRAMTLSEQVDSTLAAERLVMRLCSLFGGLSLLLASVGLYGVLAYAVSLRTGEIGIRMALGATSLGIRWLVVRETWRMVVVGMAIGLALSLISTRVVAGLLFGVTATNPGTIISAMIIVAMTAVLAACIPARRAVRVDPLVALRQD